MKRFLKSLRLIDYVIFIVICGLVVLQVICDLALPEYMGSIIKLIQEAGSTSDIWIQGLKMIGISLGSVSCSIVVGYLASVIAAGFGRNTRKNLFAKVNSFSMEEINKFSTASLITRTTNDVTQVQNTVTLFLKLALSAPIMAVCAIIKIVNKSATLTWVTAIAVLSVLALIIVVTSIALPKFKKIQIKTDKLNSVSRENLTGLRVVRANNAESTSEEKFDNVNTDLTKTNLFVNRITSLMMPGMNLIMNCLALAIVWVGSYLISGGGLSLENMSVFTMYAMQVIMSFLMMSMLLTVIPRSIVSLKRINEVLGTKNKIVDGNAEVSNEVFGNIEFKNVSFRYPESDEYVLKNINFTAHIGETVAFIGSTGSGKSTVINLIPRFYDATEGEVIVDGMNVKDYKFEDLNAKIGYVPQKSTLFARSIKENMLYSNPDATDEEIYRALDIAQASEFVNGLEDKIDYEIAQGGNNVSGGQKQRLQIARAIVKKPEIYIFDDSFSALDYRTDKLLRERLKPETRNAITLIVAQRIGTIIDADKIVVLDNGEMVGVGTHKELMENCKVYQQIAFSQLSKEELK